jgi:hypothetical protein
MIVQNSHEQVLPQILHRAPIGLDRPVVQIRADIKVLLDRLSPKRQPAEVDLGAYLRDAASHHWFPGQTEDYRVSSMQP